MELKKRLKHRNIYMVFCSYTKSKAMLFTMFFHPEAPKSSQNSGNYNVFAIPKQASIEKRPLFATLSQHNMSEMVYFTELLDHLL